MGAAGAYEAGRRLGDTPCPRREEGLGRVRALDGPEPGLGAIGWDTEDIADLV